MNKRLNLLLLAGVSAFTFGSTAAHAQIDEIITTATKRSETVQDVPLSVTAFSQEDLDLKGATNISGIQESTPNLNFSIQSAGQNAARVTLRGIGSETLVGGGDPGVALHVDGVYVGRNSAAAGDVFDVERVEVLRGPQGTLYGRNATGGSVNIISQRPVQEVEGYADFTYGNYNNLRVRGVANTPLTDNLAARVAFFAESRDGFIENQFEAGRDSFDKNVHGGRLQLLYEADSGNEFLVRGYYSKSGGAGPGSVYLGTDFNDANGDGYPDSHIVGINGGVAGQAGPPPGVPITADVYGIATAVNGNPLAPRSDDLFESNQDAPEFADQFIRGIDFEANINITDGILLKSISSYQANDNEILVDSDNSAAAIQTRFRDNSATQFSQEFNLISQTDSPLQWIAGAYYYKEELDEHFETFTPAGLVPGAALPLSAVPGGGGVFQQRIADHEAESFALFGQLSYDITDRLSVTGGLRHSWDEKTQSRDIGGQVDLTTDVRFLGDGALGPLGPDSGSENFSEFTYRVSADYQIADNSLLFASYARGYKVGGFDLNGGQLVGTGGDEQVPYDPEFVDAFEIGSKNKFFDNKVLLNLTAFHYDYKDLQVFLLTAFGPLTDNAAQSTIQGIEVEAKFEPTDNLSFDGSLGLLDAEYDEYLVPAQNLDFSGNTLNYAPSTTASIGASYTANLENADIIFRGDWSYRSDIFFDRGNTEFDTQEAHSLFNGRIRYDADKYYVDIWGRNLGDKERVTGQLINPPFACGCRTVNLGAPRTYGITIGTNW